MPDFIGDSSQNYFNQFIPILTRLVSVLVSAVCRDFGTL
jgi:hypothetical protein